ncbi:MAG TPA: DUF4242 domain-containing protein [Nevskiaceae bacterium]|nr:DUF4242 domain-containing protein [Nevskiaceae bacterium]
MRINSFVLPLVAGLTFSMASWAADAPQASTPRTDAAPAVAAPKAGMKRYMIVRTFPAGALDGLDAAGKKEINKKNAENSARWVYSYANADKTKTYCIYEAPNEQAVRDAAKANKIPVDSIEEIPVVLTAR